jgi:hypothetical protein
LDLTHIEQGLHEPRRSGTPDLPVHETHAAWIIHMKIAQVRRYALSLADATEEPHFDHSSFRVRGRIFVTVPPDEEHIHVFVGDQEREQALIQYPAFVEKLVWGERVRGLRIRLSEAPPALVNRLVRAAWLHKAPKRLVAASDANQ